MTAPAMSPTDTAAPGTPAGACGQPAATGIRLRPPVVAGLAAGAGASTVATVLHGVDAGVVTGLVARLQATASGPADLLVTRSDPASLRLLGDTAVGAGTVVAVVVEPGTRAPRAVRGAAHVVAVPHLPELAAGRVPAGQLGLLLARDVRALPAALRDFTEALRTVAAALVAGGRLAAPAPAPYLVPVPARIGPDLDDLDDEALDDEILALAAS